MKQFKLIKFALTVFSLLLFVSSCKNRKVDNVYCGGDCPYDKECKLNKCVCPENSKEINGTCINLPDKRINSITNATYYSDNSNCIFSDCNFGFMGLIRPTNLYDSTHQVNFFDNSYSFSKKSDFSLVKQGLFNTSLMPNGDIRLEMRERVGLPCTSPSNTNNLIIIGIMTPNFDTLRFTYYISCGNGLKDTCSETRYLIK